MWFATRPDCHAAVADRASGSAADCCGYRWVPDWRKAQTMHTMRTKRRPTTRHAPRTVGVGFVDCSARQQRWLPQRPVTEHVWVVLSVVAAAGNTKQQTWSGRWCGNDVMDRLTCVVAYDDGWPRMRADGAVVAGGGAGGWIDGSVHSRDRGDVVTNDSCGGWMAVGLPNIGYCCDSCD